MFAGRSDSPDKKSGRRQHRWGDVDVGSQVVDSHQLPVRLRGHARTSMFRGGCVDATAGDACPRCKAIDFPRVLAWQAGQARPWVSLSHVLLERPPPAADAAECPYCVFFRRMLDPAHVADGTTKFQPYLRIWRAFERIHGVSEKHELAGSVVMEVRGKNKSLPWGYLVKQADGGDDVDDYEGKNGAALLGRRVPPLVDVAVLKCWMAYCLSEHECAGEKSVEGLTLLDCRNLEVVDVEERVDYLAMSYVRDTEDEEEPPDLADLPATFKDAASLTVSLGYQYIWIDRLCAKPEQRVDGVFANAIMALILPNHPSAQGILGVSISRDEQLSLKTDNAIFTTTLVRPDIEVASSQWASQPALFAQGSAARRRIVLTSSQAYFQCREMHCHESVSLPLRLAGGISRSKVFDDSAGLGESATTKESTEEAVE